MAGEREYCTLSLGITYPLSATNSFLLRSWRLHDVTISWMVTFLLPRTPNIHREDIVIVNKFEFEMLTNLYFLDSGKHNFGIMSVCEHDN